MNSVIFKYPLQITDEQYIRMPANSAILSVQFQGSTLCLWAFVERDSKSFVDRHIAIYGTGNVIHGTPGRFIDTVQDPRGLVWHICELEQP